MIPHKDPKLNQKHYQVGDVAVTQFVSTEFFAVYEWKVDGGQGTFTRGTARIPWFRFLTVKARSKLTAKCMI